MRQSCLPLTRLELLGLNLELDQYFAREDYPKEETDTVCKVTRDSKWRRGRTHDTLHFGAKAIGPYASSLRVAAIPLKIMNISENLQDMRSPDVATLVYYRKGSYSPPMRLSGLGTDFEDGFTWVCCLQGCINLVLNASVGAVQKDKEGVFREEMTKYILLQEGNAWRYNDLESPLAVNRCEGDSRLLMIRCLSAEARERLQLRDSRFRRSGMQQMPLPLPPKCIGVELKHRAGRSALEVPSVEAEHVRAVYDTIASHWDHTRYKAWPRVANFLNSLPDNALVADIGCGNGKYLRCRKRSVGRIVGIDTCIPLLRKAQRERQDKRDRGEVCAGDAVSLPFRNELFDAAIVIAVLHHLSTIDRRIAAIREVARLVRNEGRILIYGWALEQGSESRRTFPSSDVLVPWHLSDHMAELEEGIPESSGSAQVHSNIFPTHGKRVETKNSTVFSRYCHVFAEGEIEGLVKAAGGCLKLLDSYYDCSNWCVVAEKCPSEGTHPPQ